VVFKSRSIAIVDQPRPSLVFARKIIRPFGQVHELDISNEATYTAKILQSGGHKNIIGILGHGWIDSHYQYYFIDMEYCDFNDPTTIIIEMDDSPDRESDCSAAWNDKKGGGVVHEATQRMASGQAFLHSRRQIHLTGQSIIMCHLFKQKKRTCWTSPYPPPSILFR
jgi:hypothetical protein